MWSTLGYIQYYVLHLYCFLLKMNFSIDVMLCSVPHPNQEWFHTSSVHQREKEKGMRADKIYVISDYA